MKKDWLKISGMHDGATSSVFKNARKLRDSMTESEIQLWNYLKTKPKGYKFRRQHPISGYVLDFFCHKLRLSIEIDGGYHLKLEQIKKDKERTEYLNEIGITEIRFTNKQILEDFQVVVKELNILLSGDSPLGAGGQRKGEIKLQ